MTKTHNRKARNIKTKPHNIMVKAHFVMKKVQQSLDKSTSLNNKSCYHYITNLEHAVRSVRMYRPTAPNPGMCVTVNILHGYSLLRSSLIREKTS